LQTLQLKNELTEAKRARAGGFQAINSASSSLALTTTRLQHTRAALERTRNALSAAQATVQRYQKEMQENAKKQAEKQELAVLVEQRRAEAFEAKRYPIDDYQLAQVCPAHDIY
jgi:predicted naringenin-chalcone synthase